MPGVPWHVTGALLGLDIALAPLALRRAMSDGVPDAPRLPSIEREAFAAGVSLADTARHTDRDRDRIAGAIAMGRQRVGALVAGIEPFAGVADAIRADGWRRRSLRWLLQNDPAVASAYFSLAELLVLGGGGEVGDLEAWGAPGTHAWSCACTWFPPPGTWTVLAGRTQLPMMAASLVEVQLKVATMLSELRLPAALARPVMACAMQDFLDTASPVDPTDWWNLSRAVQALSRQRFEDYVAAATTDGPLVPDDPGWSRQN
jgi:hypothetical protein